MINMLHVLGLSLMYLSDCVAVRHNTDNRGIPHTACQVTTCTIPHTACQVTTWLMY